MRWRGPLSLRRGTVPRSVVLQLTDGFHHPKAHGSFQHRQHVGTLVGPTCSVPAARPPGIPVREFPGISTYCTINFFSSGSCTLQSIESGQYFANYSSIERVFDYKTSFSGRRSPTTKLNNLTRKCTLWRCKSTPTPKAKLLWMTSHYGPTVVRSVTEIPFHVFI